MAELSPAAQAAMKAYWDTPNEPITVQVHQAAVAAALRAATDQVVPISTNRRQNEIRTKLLAISDELELLH